MNTSAKRREIIAKAHNQLRGYSSLVSNSTIFSAGLILFGKSFLHRYVSRIESKTFSSCYPSQGISHLSSYRLWNEFKAFLKLPIKLFNLLTQGCLFQSRLSNFSKDVLQSYLDSYILTKSSCFVDIKLTDLFCFLRLICLLSSGKLLSKIFFAVPIVLFVFSANIFVRLFKNNKYNYYLYITTLHYSPLLFDRILLAIVYSAGVPVIIGQHGGHYMICQYSLDIYENYISDYRILLLPETYASSTKFPSTNCEFFNHITLHNQSFLSRFKDDHFDCVIVLQGLAKVDGYLIDQVTAVDYPEYINYVESVALYLNTLGFKVAIKGSIDRGWREVNRLMSLENITYIGIEESFISVSNRCKFVIHTYLSTAILECIHMEKEFIYLSFENYFLLSELGKVMFRDLDELFFDSPDKLFRFIAKFQLPSESGSSIIDHLALLNYINQIHRQADIKSHWSLSLIHSQSTL